MKQDKTESVKKKKIILSVHMSSVTSPMSLSVGRQVSPYAANALVYATTVNDWIREV